MSRKSIIPSSPSTQKFQLGLQPALAWTAILGLIVISAGCTLVAGKLMNLLFPAGCFAVGLLLYLRYPILYVGFTWWVWFLTPLVRRLADYHSRYTSPSPILLTPIVVTLISGITLVRYFPKSYRQGSLPFILCFLSVMYASLTGIIQNDSQSAILSLLDWLTPILFGFHLFAQWKNYPSYRQNIQRVFLWGVILMGLYGIWQFLVAPQWDSYWLINTPVTSFGYPKPLRMRVWSTMNGPQPFAATLMAGLILLFTNEGMLRFVGIGSGYLSFLLSRARAPWLGWIAALLTFLPSLKSSLQIRIIISLTLALLLVVPLTTIEPFAETIGSRISSFSGGENDNSLQDRSEGYNRLLNEVLSEYVGKGLGYTITDDSLGGNDGSILPTLFLLGWLGTLIYLGGILLIFARLFQGVEANFDPVASASRAIALGTLAQVPFNFVLVAPIGVVLWGFLGMAMAASCYYRSQAFKT